MRVAEFSIHEKDAPGGLWTVWGRTVQRQCGEGQPLEALEIMGKNGLWRPLDSVAQCKHCHSVPCTRVGKQLAQHGVAMVRSVIQDIYDSPQSFFFQISIPNM